jgi:acyl-CoA synthetase (AMP-forming)/AMP-acid ligase II
MPESILFQSFSRLVDADPDALAVRHDGVDWSRRRVLDEALRWDVALRDIEPGSIVAVSAGNSPWFFSSFLAALRRGLAYLPIEPSLLPVERGRLLQHASASAELKEDGTVLLLDGALRVPTASLIKTTSGSTGRPRAVEVTESQFVADGKAICEAMEIGPTDVNWGAIRLGHSYGLGNLVAPLFLQGTAVVLQELFAPAAMSDSDVTVFPGVPFMFEHIVRHELGIPSTIRLLISAGAPISNEVRQAVRDRAGLSIHSFYGSSETGGICYDGSESIEDAAVVGYPMPGVSVTVRDDGRVVVSGPAVADGYFAEESDAFTGGAFETGDEGRWLEDGRLRLEGRVSTFVNVSGRKVDPGEVETVIAGHSEIHEVVVLGIPDPARGQILWAFYRGAVLTNGVLRTFCSERMSAWKIPRGFTRVDSFPVDARGKLDRSALISLI